MLTLTRCEQIIAHALGSETLPPNVSVLEFVDRAGLWLCSFPWRWLERTGTLGTTVNVAYVNLPAGTTEVYRAQSRGRWMDATTLGAILDLRSAAVVGYPTSYAVAYDQTAAGVLTPRLELYPTPSVTDATAIYIHYKAGWAGPQNDTDTARIPIPEWLEPLYTEALIAYAMGVEERDVAPVDARLVAIQTGPLFLAAVRQDGSMQTNHGQMRGGAVVVHGYDGPYRNFRVQP